MKINLLSKFSSSLLLSCMLLLCGAYPAVSTTHKRIILRDNLAPPGAVPDNGFPLKIFLAPGFGVTINFGSLGESIQSVWLDNPSFATLDTNSESATSVIHLRRIQTVDLDGILNTPTTGLTVVTKTNDGRERVYLFKVVKANHPSTLLIDFYRPTRRQTNACGTEGIEAQIASKQNQIIVSRLKESMRLAYANGLLKVDSPLNSRLNELSNLVSCGMSLTEATAKTGISNRLIDSLFSLRNDRIVKPKIEKNNDELSKTAQ